MSMWRRKALELFPNLRRELNDREYTIYVLYFDLLPMVREAHEENDCDLLRRIYGFAAWCFDQKAKDVWNSAAVAFYEHLFDERKLWSRVIPWLSPKVITECWPLWEFRLSAEELKDIQRLITARKKHAYREPS
jgi:hypothetical protein